MSHAPRPRRARPTTGRRRAGFAIGASVLGLGLVAVQALTGGPASAQTLAYQGTATGGTITIDGGGVRERVITDPGASISATFDDVTGAFTGTPTFESANTDTFLGPSNLALYLGVKLTATAPFTGTVDEATKGFTGTGSVTLAVTIYSQAGPSQNPATDGQLTNPSTCSVNVSLAFVGATSSFDSTTGALQLADPTFTIPQFLGGCGPSTGIDLINRQLPGAANSVDFTFAGDVTATTTSTTSSTIARDTTSSSIGSLPPIPTSTTTGAGQCSPNYAACVRVRPGAINCGDVEGNARNFKVIGTDPYGLDGDNDGIACQDPAVSKVAKRPLPKGPLARTGQDSRTYAVAGGMLLLAGAGLLRLRRSLVRS